MRRYMVNERGSCISEHPDGKYVLYSDLAAAQAEVERLTAANQMHREAAMQIAKDAEAEAATLREAFERECADGDRLCDALGVSRTEGGSLNVPKMLAAIKAAVEKEREACALIAETRTAYWHDLKDADQIADEIRARGAAHE